MSVRSLANRAGASLPSKGSRLREVVLPKPISDKLGLAAGDVMEVVAPRRLVILRPGPSSNADTLTPIEARKVRRALKQMLRGETRSWRAIKDELGL